MEKSIFYLIRSSLAAPYLKAWWFRSNPTAYYYYCYERVFFLDTQQIAANFIY